jgi:hypothetical protein
MTRPSHPPRLDYSNYTWRRVQIMKLLTRQYIPLKHQQPFSRLYGAVYRGMAILLQESRSNMCNLQQSPQQLLYNLYNSVAITELKGYAMMQFSWMLLRLYKKGITIAIACCLLLSLFLSMFLHNNSTFNGLQVH